MYCINQLAWLDQLKQVAALAAWHIKSQYVAVDNRTAHCGDFLYSLIRIGNQWPAWRWQIYSESISSLGQYCQVRQLAKQLWLGW